MRIQSQKTDKLIVVFYDDDKFVIAKRNELRYWQKIGDNKWTMQDETIHDDIFVNDDQIMRVLQIELGVSAYQQESDLREN